jgi:hypothetical protein
MSEERHTETEARLGFGSWELGDLQLQRPTRSA